MRAIDTLGCLLHSVNGDLCSVKSKDAFVRLEPSLKESRTMLISGKRNGELGDSICHLDAGVDLQVKELASE